MLDYNKLFALGNIVGIRDRKDNRITNEVIKDVNKYLMYKNSGLSSSAFKEIQYIISIDTNGDIIEKIFDRNRDMINPFELVEDGNFVLVYTEDIGRLKLGYVNINKNNVIYQLGGYDYFRGEYGLESFSEIEIIAIYDAVSFNTCKKSELRWYNKLYEHLVMEREE